MIIFRFEHFSSIKISSKVQECVLVKMEKPVKQHADIHRKLSIKIHYDDDS